MIMVYKRTVFVRAISAFFLSEFKIGKKNYLVHSRIHNNTTVLVYLTMVYIYSDVLLRHILSIVYPVLCTTQL